MIDLGRHRALTHDAWNELAVRAAIEEIAADVPNDAFIKVTEYLDNFRNVRAALNEICAINTELMRRREDLD